MLRFVEETLCVYDELQMHTMYVMYIFRTQEMKQMNQYVGKQIFHFVLE